MSVVQAEGSRCDIISAVITKTESEEAANVSLQRREEREEQLKTPGGGVKRRRGGGEETSPQSENEMCARSRRAFSVYTGLKLSLGTRWIQTAPRWNFTGLILEP